jgi:hypothetical protein
MEVLNVLEKKIASLIELTRVLKAEKLALAQENLVLKEKMERLETSLLTQEQDAQEHSQEIVLTKMMVDDLIANIDQIINPEPQQ